MKVSFLARVSLIGLTALLAVAPQAAALAGAPVDPTTLIPPPPPEFNPICGATGFGTLCHEQFSDPPLVNDPNTLPCVVGTMSFLNTQTRSVDARRYYDQANKLTEVHYREVLNATLTNPVTGATVLQAQDDTVIEKLAIPGDFGSSRTTITGLVRFLLPGGRTLLIDAGQSINDGAGNLIGEHGPHPLNDYFVFGNLAALQPLCDVLQ